MEQRHSAASIEAALREHVIGQDEAVRTFAVAVANHLAARDYQGDVQLQKTNILILGPTGCLAGETLVETAHGFRRIDRLGTTMVRTMSGALAPASFFAKGRKRLYRVRHEHGSFSGTAEHRVLAERDGQVCWLALGDLRVGDGMLERSPLPFVEVPRSSTSALGSRGALSGVRHFDRTPLCSRFGCHPSCRSCDERPHRLEASDLVSVPPRDGALERSHSHSQDDGPASTASHSQTCPDGDRPSTTGSPRRGFRDRVWSQDATQSDAASLSAWSSQAPWRSDWWSSPALAVLEDGPLGYRPDTSASRVLSITFDRYDDYYDGTVPGWANYRANGVWQHNSGKTEMVRRLAEYLDVPFEAIPAPAITQSGFAGFDPDAILKKLVQKHGKDKAAYAIAYIDECFPPETELLTEDGFVRFDRIDGTRRVAQYHVDGMISFVRPERVIQRWHEGELLRFRAGFGVHVSTPGHRRVVIKPRGGLFSGEVEQTLVSNYRVPVAGIVDGPGVPLSDAELRLVVAFLADGCVKNKVYGYVAIKRARKVARMDEILSALAIRVTRKTVAHGYTAYYFGRFFESVLRKDGTGKIIKLLDPSWLTELSAHQREVFLSEIVEWDGSRTNGPATQFFSSELSNAELVSAIATTGGYSTHIKARQKKGYRPNYAVTMSPKRTRTQQGKPSLTRIPYSGLVYCVTVPTGMIVIRHEGTTQVSGNCDKIARKASDEDDKQKNLTTGTGVQQALLEVIGGGKVELGSGGLFDTRNVLFVLSGAFVGLERVIAHRLESQRAARRSTISAAALLRQVEPQDIVNYGMIPEFVGRLPVIIPMRPLGESDILRILTEPKDAPVRQMIARAEVLGATLTIDPVWLYSVAREALARGTGARGLIAVLQAHLVQAFFEMGPGDLVHVDGDGMVRIEKAAPVPAPDALAGRVDDESGRVEV